MNVGIEDFAPDRKMYTGSHGIVHFTAMSTILKCDSRAKQQLAAISYISVKGPHEDVWGTHAGRSR